MHGDVPWCALMCLRHHLFDPVFGCLRCISEACHGHHSLCCQVKWLKRSLYLGNSLSIRLLFQVHLHPVHSLCFKYTSMHRVVSVWDRDLQKLWSKSQEYYDCFFWRLCVCVCQALITEGATASDCQPWCLHIFAAVATNIAQTRCDGSSQVWSHLMMHEQKPLATQSVCHGLLQRICGCHSLEGVAWSRPGYPQWRWCRVGHPLRFAWESHLWSL